MEYHKVTTHTVEAQDNCAYSIEKSFAGIGTAAQQPPFAPVTRRALMAAVNTASRALGLRPATVVVLDALLSCLPCNDPKTGSDAPITPRMLLTVYACNDTLCFRAKGITDRQLRRHLEKLECLNLIQRRDSANGKRFPIMRKGKVVAAFGLDLSPLLARSAEILALAQEQRDTMDELRGMKAYIQKLRLECLALTLTDQALGFVEAARNLIRRAGVTVLHANSIIGQLKAILNGHQPAHAPQPEKTVANTPNQVRPAVEKPNKPTATDGQNVRHKETQKSYTKKTTPEDIPSLWASLSLIPSFYPDCPKSQHALLQLLFDFGVMLRISSTLLGKAVATLGLSKTVQLADQIAGRVDQVENPEGYLSKIIASRGQGGVGHGQLWLPQ